MPHALRIFLKVEPPYLHTPSSVQDDSLSSAGSYYLSPGGEELTRADKLARARVFNTTAAGVHKERFAIKSCRVTLMFYPTADKHTHDI